MKKLFVPLALILVAGSCIRVHQRKDSSNLILQEQESTPSTTTPKVNLPDLGINYKQEITCNNYKRLQLDFNDDLNKLNRVVDKVPNFVSMLKSIKTVLEIIVEQFTPSQTSSFIQTNVKSDISKLEKELFTYEDLEFLTFDQQTQRIIRDISDALKLIKQESKDNKPMITACNRVISEVDFLIDYWTQVKEYVDKEIINKVFIDRKYKLDNADEVCTKYVLEEGEITFKVPQPYQTSQTYRYYRKIITFAQKYSNNVYVGFSIVDYVADKFEEGKQFGISVGYAQKIENVDKYDLKFISVNGSLLSITLKYYVYRKEGSRLLEELDLEPKNNFTAKSSKPQNHQTMSKRAIFMQHLFNQDKFANKYSFEVTANETKTDYTVKAQSKGTFSLIMSNGYFVY